MALFSTFNGICAQGYQPLATDFDAGETMTWTSLSGATAYSQGILMAWVRPTLFDSTGPTLFTFGNLRLSISGVSPFTDRRAVLDLAGTGGILSFQSSANITTTGVWRQILASWNTNATAGARSFTMVINGTTGTQTVTDTGSAFAMDAGAAGIGYSGNLSEGCWSEFYFAPGQYLDFSVQSNRNKFVTAGGTPVYLGTNGTLPTGTQPLIYLKNPYSSYNTNSGTGGNAVVNGTLSACASAP